MIRLQALLLLALTSACVGFDVFHSQHADGRYRMGYWDAHRHCASLGAHLATRDELEELRRTNYSMCSCGWTLDKTAHFPMTYAHPACGSRAGLHHCDWRSAWDAYCFRGDAIGNCSRALGIESGDIHHSQMYASSEYHSWFPIFQNSKWSASIARLHNKDLVNAWVPKYNGRNQWLEVDLERPTAVTGILTQGASRLGKKMWVTSFEISYSKDRQNYKKFDKIFMGNVNNDGIKRNMFPEPALARYIRFTPFSYHHRVALRLELLGCDLETYQLGVKGGQKDIVVITNDPFSEFPPEDAE